MSDQRKTEESAGDCGSAQEGEKRRLRRVMSSPRNVRARRAEEARRLPDDSRDRERESGGESKTGVVEGRCMS